MKFLVLVSLIFMSLAANAQVLPTPTATPIPSPTASPPKPTPTPSETNYQCWNDDQTILLSFLKLRTPMGDRTFVTSTPDGTIYNLFTKPFCNPTPELLGAFVSYVNPSYVHVKFPIEQRLPGLTGILYLCMGDLCPGEIPIYCDESLKTAFQDSCGQ